MSALLAHEQDACSRFSAWETVLDRLEQDVRLSERMLADLEPDLEDLERGLGDWQPPTLDGPLPEVLLPRAREIEGRQAAVREGLGRALVGTRAGIERARRTAFAEAPAAPAYVDVSA